MLNKIEKVMLADEVKTRIDKIDGIESSLAETATRINATNQGEKINLDGGMRFGIRPKTPIITFTSDDGRIEDYTKIKPLFQAKGIPLTMGLIPSLSYDNANRTSVTQLNELLGMGWEIASHTYTHPQLATLTDKQIDDELRLSKEAMESTFGIEIKHIIYPYGSHDTRVRKAARKYYRSGTSTNPGVNGEVHNTYALNRVALGSYFDTVDPALGYPATNTLEYYKIRVDEAISKNAWLIFMMHPWDVAHDAVQQQYLSDLIDYIQSKNVPIMNIEDALDKVGNLIDVGDYGQTNGYLAVGSEGKTDTSYAFRKVPSAGITNATPLSAFESNTVSVTNISIAAGAGFPSDAGILETYNLSSSDYAFQIFYHYASDNMYRRRWDSTNKKWYDWINITPGIEMTVADKYSGTTSASAFPYGKITATRITASGTNGVPNNVAGFLFTNKLIGSDYTRQTFYVYNSSLQYERYWTSGATWSEWEVVVKRMYTGTFNTFDFGTVPANGQVERTFAITGVLTGDVVIANPRGVFPSGLTWCSYVGVADQITVRVSNVTTSPVVTSPMQWKISVTR